SRKSAGPERATGSTNAKKLPESPICFFLELAIPAQNYRDSKCGLESRRARTSILHHRLKKPFRKAVISEQGKELVMMQDEYEAPFLDKFLKCLCSNSLFEFKKHLDDGRKHVFR